MTVMKIRIAFIVPVLTAIIIISGCTPKARYERRLKQELASGVRNDSIFMGLYLGMSQRDFFTRCWNLHDQGLFHQNTSNTAVEYRIKGDLKYPATMFFYPNFSDGKISEMPVFFKYDGWAPWNKKLSADSLQLAVLKYYKKQYGEDFMTIRHQEYGNAYVKIDGNRRITIYKKDELYVRVLFTDLLAKIDTAASSKPIRVILDTTKTIEKK